jgi:hypothetical protein
VMLTIPDHLGCVRTYIQVMLTIPDHLACVRTYIQVMLTIPDHFRWSRMVNITCI